MRKITLYILVFINTSFLFAQVGIGTTTPRATLEISESDNGGLLIPQYALTGNNDVTTVVNPQGGALIDGTLVYNTTSIGGGNAIAKGFAYWDATTSTWIEVGGGEATAGWELNGNAVDASDFLGTTNFQSLRFRTNNNEVGSFHPNGGMYLGIGANSNNNNGIAIGLNAEAFGNNAIVLGGGGEASEQNSIAIGDANSMGIGSVAIGNNSEAQGANSTAVGANSDASGPNSIAIGRFTDASGTNSAAFGFDAEARGQNATAIGYQSDAPNETTIILGNNDTTAGLGSSKIGIGTSDPTAKLQVNGSLRYVDGNEATGNVLTSDANGNATWEVPSAAAAGTQVMMRRYIGGGFGGAGFVFNFASESFNNITSSSFAGTSITLPTGVYIVESDIRLSSNNTIDWVTRLDGTAIAGSVIGSSNPAGFNTNAGTIQAVAVFEITGATGVVDFEVTGGNGAGAFPDQSYVVIKKIN